MAIGRGSAQRAITQESSSAANDPPNRYAGSGMGGQCGSAHALFDFELNRFLVGSPGNRFVDVGRHGAISAQRALAAERSSSR